MFRNPNYKTPMKFNKTALLIFAFIPMLVFCQNDTLSKKQIRKQRPTYIKTGLGSGFSYFRDFATSPLNYVGLPIDGSIAHLKLDDKREYEFGVYYSFGFYSAYVESTVGKGLAHIIGTNYSRLYQLKKLSVKNWNVKAGGMVDATFSLRYNEGLGNNSGGSELFATLFASGIATKDITRDELKQKKIWFVKYSLKPRKQALSFRLNLALMNNTYRNGYAYNGQAYLVNDLKSFDNYKFKIFSGYRMSSSLDYTYFLKNKNALQFTYLWDAYKTGGDLDKFEMAHHTFKFSLLFNTK